MQREKFWDIIKGVAILLVVLGHSIEFGGGLEYRESGEYFNNPLFLFIYSFHMPLFMIVSGYFFYLTVTRKDRLSIIKNKCLTLFVPILCFALINASLAFRPPFSIENFVLCYFQRLPSTLWFLWDLLIFTCIKILQRWLQVDTILVDVLISCAMCILPNQPLGAFLAFMYPFFCIGYYVNKKGLFTLLEQKTGLVLIVSCISFGSLVYFFRSDYLVYKSGTCLITTNSSIIKQCGINIYRILMGLLGSMTIASLVKYIQLSVKIETIIGNTLAKIGVLSMGIYCFQDVSLCIYHHFTRSFAQPSFCYWMAAFCVLLTICILMTLASKRSAILNVLLLGGR